ncbi:MAG TPA: hypothetical protein VJP80_07045 [Candidatus Saccharimonadales bacterium]|nr:hypothetical protein [Candidatus Saccharimonadales bacterium]
MKHRVTDFTGDLVYPDVLISPLVDRDVGTLISARNQYAIDPHTVGQFKAALETRFRADEPVTYTDIEGIQPTKEQLLAGFEAATGLTPGLPTFVHADLHSRQTETGLVAAEDITEKRLQLFYEQTGAHQREITEEDCDIVTGASTSTFDALVEIPEGRASVWAILHELGHCATPLNGLQRSIVDVVDQTTGDHKKAQSYRLVTTGLRYTTQEFGFDEYHGSVPSEAIAEGLGTLANQKLALAETFYTNGSNEYPGLVAPYVQANESRATAAPSAVAFELMAEELGMPPEAFFRMFANYAQAGVHNLDARRPVAKAVYRATRGNLTLGNIELLPYPSGGVSDMALLWAVEDAIGIPPESQPSQYFVD